MKRRFKGLMIRNARHKEYSKTYTKVYMGVDWLQKRQTSLGPETERKSNTENNEMEYDTIKKHDTFKQSHKSDSVTSSQDQSLPLENQLPGPSYDEGTVFFLFMTPVNIGTFVLL